MNTTLTDEQLDLWGEVYVACQFRNKFYFHEFIQNPWQYLHKEHQESAAWCILNGYLPLLPEQAKVIADYWSDAEILRLKQTGSSVDTTKQKINLIYKIS